ncbi:MAG: prepilin peptidase [Candidatus Saccharimonadales bacterium]
MEQIYIYVGLTLLGLCFGSFAAATVWRLRAKQLFQDKHDGEKVPRREYENLLPLAKTKTSKDYSRCLHCQHRLAWYDLIPVLSWLQIGGKCRYCHKPIGWMEPLAELAVTLFFVGSYMVWPIPLTSGTAIVEFIIWLIAGVMLAILFMYDLRWFLLPNQVVYPLIGLGAVATIIHLAPHLDDISKLLSVIGAVAILSGLYGLLWLLSKGAWIGFGDVKLGLGLALLLGQWDLAIIALFAANVIGCIIVLPGMLSGKLKRTSHVPFGPLLIGGYIIAGLWGSQLIDWYFSLTI